ncbi:MAG: zinc-binding dehydrogenase [Lachnospiraceae bacterium]|nr:zinc-binding dehydrogenase [Lachnospiraceae bacterium]MDD3794388.1 zinc-binding dehydrogenase [Lachnospiraceae bacterium]
MKTFVVNKDGSTEIKEIAKPRYSSKQALVKTIACGMCGTDVKLLHRTFKGFPESVYPIMLGHEGVGEVVEVGSEVTTFKIGDKVILPFVDPDPELYPGLGSGWGALSEYAVVCDPAAWPKGEAPGCAYAQTVLSDDLDPVDAVMIVTFREVLSNIRYFGIKPGDSVVVFGCGPVGSTFIKFLNLCGITEVTAVDIIDEKLENVKANGAAHIINSKNSDVTAEVRKLYPDGVDYVLDAIGAPFVVNAAMPLIKDRGTVLCYGVPEKEEITIDFSKADYNWRVIYQQMPRKEEEGAAHEQVLEWIRSGKLVIKDFISDYFKFEDSVDAYEKLLDRKITKKGVIVF